MKIGYIPEYTTGSGQGSDQSLSDRLESSSESAINSLEVFIREHVQNSRDAYQKRKNKPEKLKFKVSRKQIDYSFAKLDELKSIIDQCITHKKIQIKEEFQDKDEALVRLKNTSVSLSKRKSDVFWSTIVEDNGIGLNGHSRFYSKDGPEKKPGTMVILDEGDSNKNDSSNGGAFGVGKLTAFSNNDFYTVFYLTQQKDEIRIIGKTKIESYADSNGRQCGPNAFFGEISNNNPMQFESSDWFLARNNISKIRSINDDGLTTLIPTLNQPNTDDEWISKVAYSIIHSYFKLFKSNQIEVTIVDDLIGDKLEITTKNYKEQYLKCESLSYLKEDENLYDNYNYHLLKPLILGEEKFKYKRFEKEFNVTNLYKGKAILHIYHYPKLNEIIDSIGKRNLQRTFRYVRGGMLLRSELLPKTQVFDCSYCGYIEFDDKEGSYLNEILRSGETQSHDKLDINRYKKSIIKNFPAYNTLNQKLFSPISSWIREEVESLSALTSNDGDEYELEFDFLDGFNSENLNPSFERNIISDELLQKIKERNQSGKVNPQGSNGTNTQQGTSSGEGGIVIEGGTTSGGKGAKGGEASQDGQGGASGNQQGVKETKLSSISYMSKILNKDGRHHEYAIKLYNVTEKINIEISQDSTLKNSILSFEIQAIEVNGKEYYDYTKLTSNTGMISGYRIDDVEPTGGGIILLKLNVIEPSLTESRFNLLIS